MYKIEFPVSDAKLNDNLVTQPNQSFSIRQIIEQFARNEVIPPYIQPSDMIDEGSYTDEQMVNDVIEFEDKIDAENHLIENRYETKKPEPAPKSEGDQGQHSVESSNQEAPSEAS